MEKYQLKYHDGPPPELPSEVECPEIGTLTEWNDERGFGFIVPKKGGKKVFLHISGLRQGARRPMAGDEFFYTLSSDEHGRPRAIDAYNVVLDQKRSAPFFCEIGRLLSFCFVLSIGIVVVLARVLHSCLLGILVGSFINSVLTIICYRSDKYFAQQKIWRIPEKCLHFWELFWGWPGGLYAQRKFRHKSAKASYQVTFWLCVAVNCAVSFWLIRHVQGDQLTTDAVLRFLQEFCDKISSTHGR